MTSFFIFLIIFFLEGAALVDRQIIFFLYSLVPALYYLEKQFKKETIFIPLWFFLSYFLFFLLSFLSFHYSVDKINTIDYLFFYLSAFFIFILGFNEKEKIKKIFKKIIIFLSLSSCFFSLLPSYFNLSNYFNLTPYQLIFPFYPNHNHLGDFLGLTMIYLLFDFLKEKKIKDLICLFIFFPFFLFSFSRSAYIDFLIIIFFIILNKRKFNQLPKKIVFNLLIIIFVFFLLTQKEIYQFKPISYFLPFVQEKLHFQPRSVFSGRPEYFKQAILGFLEKPFFGWGLGNFIYSSQKYVGENLQQVLSALNLPLTILTEVGVFGFLSFIFFLFLLFKNINWQNKPFYYLFFYLSLNFLTDYTYSIYGMFLLWFLLASLSMNDNKKKSFSFYPFVSFVVTFFIFLKLTGQILTLVGYPNYGFYLFSFNHSTFQAMLDYQLKTRKIEKAQQLANNYYQLSLNSSSSLSYLSQFWQNLGNKEKALFFAQQITDNDKFPSFDTLKKVYFLKKDLEGKEKADKYFMKFFENFKTTFWLNGSFEDEVWQFCFENIIVGCRYRYFYLPPKKTIEKNTNQNLPQAAYTLNNEGFNERFNYPINKEKDVFRILVIGDVNAFGFLVNTKDNWVEKLEDKFKSQNSKIKINYKKVEIINLAYHSYDLAYQVERFHQQGLKYKPHLVIWMNNNFSRINEIFLPITKKYYWIENDINEKEKYQKQGINFPSWELAYEEYQKKVKEEKIDVEDYQKEKIKEFFKLYKGPLVFINLYDIPDWVKETLLSYPDVYIFNPKDFSQNDDYYYEKVKAINPKGHEALAEMIYEFLVEEVLNNH